MNGEKALVEKTGDKHHSPEAHATINDRTGLYISIIALVLAAMGLGLSLNDAAMIKAEAANEAAKIAERESRMQQYYIIEVDAKLIKLGVELPGGGYQKFKESREVKP